MNFNYDLYFLIKLILKILLNVIINANKSNKQITYDQNTNKA